MTHVAFLGAPDVSYRERLPPPDLAPWVAVRWRIHTPRRVELRVPADELVDQRVALADVVRGGDLRRLARDAPPPDPLALATHVARDLKALRREVGYGERQLRRRVLAATGHSPKLRIARMQRVLKAGRGDSWARTAAEHGFYDEAHMAGDVAALLGATPHAALG